MKKLISVLVLATLFCQNLYAVDKKNFFPVVQTNTSGSSFNPKTSVAVPLNLWLDSSDANNLTTIATFTLNNGSASTITIRCKQSIMPTSILFMEQQDDAPAVYLPGTRTMYVQTSQEASSFTAQSISDSIGNLSGYTTVMTGVDGDGASSISVGAPHVITWTDKSGTGNSPTQATDSKRPVLIANSLNGKPALVFVSASSQVLMKTAPTTLGSLTNMSVYAVWKSTINGGDRSLMAVDDIGGLGRSWSINRDAGGTFNVRAYLEGNSGGSVYLAGVTAASDTYKYFKLTYNGGTGATLIINGSQSGASNMGSPQALHSVTSALCIGCLQFSTGSGSNLLDGGVCEILVYSGILSATQDTQVKTYLSQKWGAAILT